MYKQREELMQLDDTYVTGKYFKSLNIENPIRYIIFRRLYDLYYIVAGANDNLINAENRKLDISRWEVDKEGEEILRTFIRCENLKNCMLAYNSIEDYVLQIITFGLGLKIDYKYRNKIKNFDYSKITKKEFEEKKKREQNMKRICYANVKNALEKKVKEYKINKSEELIIYVKALNILTCYHNNYDIKEIKCLSNQQKHNNSISFKELPYPNSISYKSDEFCTDWLEPERISLEETIDMCYRANITIKRYIENIYNLVDEILEISKYK